MALPLLDTIKQNSASMAAPSLNPASGAVTGGENTQQMQSLLGTARTGKEAGPSVGGTAKLSALSEKLAGVNNLMQSNELQKQATLQSTGLEQQEQQQQQQFQQQTKAVSQERVEALTTFNTALTGMIEDQQGRLSQLDLANDKSRLEYMGQMLRLGNDKYISQLENAGRRSRLDSQAGFQQALAQTVFADEESLLGNNLTFRNMLAADDRALARQLGSMDLDFSRQIAQSKSRSAAQTTMWSGIGDTIGAGAEASSTMKKGSGGKEVTVQDSEPNSRAGDAGGNVMGTSFETRGTV